MADPEKKDEAPLPALTPESTKAEIRTALSERRHTVSHEERRKIGKIIAGRLATPPFDLLLRCDLICIYLSTPHEIPTHTFAQIAWARGKAVCVPVWDKNIKQYRLSLLSPGARLKVGRFGIREPELHIDVPAWDVHAFLIPGLAFDQHGGRLGYGGGYYDRLLATAPAAKKVGICYDWQVVNFDLPQDEHDKRVDFVMTERKLITCTPAKGGKG
ncbi:MAG: 5-formyltetrahydrofolate cyclo-ligase [Kiritimatiellae bacterium]|nr:5-formyltetrahydrofolate cyclo-ligase [Kiritimatiellia bacterium]